VESKLGPFGTAAIYCPIVPAPDDCEDGELFGGMKIGRGNRSTRRKPATVPLCPPQIPLDQTPGSNPGRRGGKPATNYKWICSRNNSISLIFSKCFWLHCHSQIVDSNGIWNHFIFLHSYENEMLFCWLNLLRDEGHLSNIQKFNFIFQENTPNFCYKDRLVNDVFEK
jgi:hypothetical protein